jgi:hypothetical protein
MSIRVPKYRFHKGSGQALVQINRERIYLGVCNSPESHEKYRRLVAEWLSGNAMAESPPASTASTQGANLVAATTIGEILVAYWGFAECYYVKDGERLPVRCFTRLGGPGSTTATRRRWRPS